MKCIRVLVLCLVVSASIECYDNYMNYINSLLETGNYKCDNDLPIHSSNPCMTSEAADLFEAELVSQYDACTLLDPSLAYTTYTYLSDWPEEYLETLSLIKYRYSGADEAVEETLETITNKSFDITATDSDQLVSLNAGSTADVMNASWIYSAKYVIDYWMKQYNTLTGMGFHTALPGFTIHPLFILNCIATTDMERKQGLYIEEIFQRINEEGVGISYSPSTPDSCPPPSPLPDALKFIIQPIQNTNRGGLIQLMADGFIPISPIAFDLNTLRFVKVMDVTRDTPILSQSTQPSMYVVVKSFATSSPKGAYWEVITNILPAMSVSLSLEMSPITTYPNTHGIAIHSVGVKLHIVQSDQPATERMCDEQLLHPGCVEHILDSSICSDTSVTTLDLSSIDALADFNGFFIPSTADCRHITDITLPPDSNEMYCAFAADTITPTLLTVLFTKCMVVEGNSISVDGGDASGGRRRLQSNNNLLGFIGNEVNRNTIVRSIRLNAGSYSAFNTMEFQYFDALEILVIGNGDSTTASFNTIAGQLAIRECPKLSKLIIAGHGSFNQISAISVSSQTMGSDPLAHQYCAYPTGVSPYETAMDIVMNDALNSAIAVHIFGTPCFKQIRVNAVDSGNYATFVLVESIGGNVLEAVSFYGSSSWMNSSLRLFTMSSVKIIRIEGSSLFHNNANSLKLERCTVLERMDIIGSDIFPGIVSGISFQLSNLPLFGLLVLNGTRILQSIAYLSFDVIGHPFSSADELRIVIDGNDNLIGFNNSTSMVNFGNVFSPISVLYPASTNPVPLSLINTLQFTGSGSNTRALCSSFAQYLKSDVENGCLE